MPSKTTHNLRRLSWPTLINPNVLVCKSRTMEFSRNDEEFQNFKNYKELRLVKLNNQRQSNLVDNLFRSIKKRKKKHPINCFNRKNVKLQFLFSYPTNSQDHQRTVNRSIMNNSAITQSATNLTELDNRTNFKRSYQVKRQLRRTRSSIGEFELLNKMEWLKAIRSSMETKTNLNKDDELNKSFNNLIKIDWNRDTIESLENAGVRLFGYVDSSPNTTTKEVKDLINKELKSDFKTTDFKVIDKDRLLIDNRIDKDDLKDNETFDIDQIVANEQIDVLNLIDEALSFPVGKWEKVDCEICFQEDWLHRRVCCNYAACSNCLSQYFQERVSLGSFSIECINNTCHAPVNRNEISISLDPKYKEIYHNLLRVNNDLGKLTRTCPNCNYIYKLKDNSELKKMRKNRKKDPIVSRVKCEECEINWCFLCHAPWHSNISCKQFIAGDRLLRDWAKQFNGGQVNAQRCPNCKAFIQRISGCDHMHCSNCETDFCYKCGEKLRALKFFGNHYSKLSVFGCKYRYKANQPALRKTVRFTVFCAKLAAAPALAGTILAGIGIAIGVGVAALPIYLALKGTRWVVEQRSNKHKQKSQLKTLSLRPISKRDIDSAILHTSTKLDDPNSQQFIHFGIGNDSPLHTATFTQNANWLANYGLMSDLNSATSTNFSSFGADLNTSSIDRNQATCQLKRRKHRKPKLVFQPIY